MRVDAHRHTQDEALARDKVKVALESRASCRNVHVDIADLQIAQAEAAIVQIRIERSHDANFGHCCVGIVGITELDRVRHRITRGQELTCPIGLRTDDRCLLALARDFLQVTRQFEGRQLADGVRRRQVRRNQRRISIERQEMRCVREPLIVIGQRRQLRHRTLGGEEVLAGLFAQLHVIDGRKRSWFIPVPRMYFAEERKQIRLRLIFASHRADQYAGRQRTHEAHHLGMFAHGRSLIVGTDHSRLFQRRDVGIRPCIGIGGQHLQRRLRRRIRQNALP